MSPKKAKKKEEVALHSEAGVDGAAQPERERQGGSMKGFRKEGRKEGRKSVEAFYPHVARCSGRHAWDRQAAWDSNTER